MKKPLKIVGAIMLSIVVLVGVGLAYLYFEAQQRNPLRPQIFADTFHPYESPIGWQTFENDFFSFQYPPELKVNSVSSGMTPGIVSYGTLYESPVNNISFRFGDLDHSKMVSILFDDFRDSGWQISLENSKFPGNLPRIADTVKRKKVESRYKNPEIFANDAEILTKDGILKNCSMVDRFAYFFEAMISDMELQENIIANTTPTLYYYSIKRPEFKGKIEFMCGDSSSRRVIMLGASNEDQSIAILEYDVRTRTALMIVSKNSFKALPLTWHFDELKDNLIQMNGFLCYELGEKKIPCWRSTAVYDLVKKEIRKISEKLFTPVLGL